jgi:hypothetical protein
MGCEAQSEGLGIGEPMVKYVAFNGAETMLMASVRSSELSRRVLGGEL